LAKEIVPIESVDNYFTLSRKLAAVGADLLLKTLKDYLAGRIQPVPQVEEGATYAALLKKEDGALDFQESAISLERRIRALVEWPVCSMTWEGQLLKIRQAQVEKTSVLKPAQRGVIDGIPAVGTSSGALTLVEVQPAGRNWMKGQDFLRGARNWSN
jgi:methionyl-tRNA formyltransferase